MKHYLLIIEGDVEPDLRGPYLNEDRRDVEAFTHRHSDPSFNDGLFRVDLMPDGELTVGSYSGGEMERGAKTIRAAVSHAVLGDLGKRRLADSEVDELIATDSTPYATGDKVTVVGVADLLGEGIDRIHGNRSVTSLFDIE